MSTVDLLDLLPESNVGKSEARYAQELIWALEHVYPTLPKDASWEVLMSYIAAIDQLQFDFPGVDLGQSNKKRVVKAIVTARLEDESVTLSLF